MTILILVGTLAVGLLIGLLLPGFFHKYRDGNTRGRGGPDRADKSKKEWFAQTIDRIIRPDSSQAPKIKIITDWASQEIEEVEVSSNARMNEILDSVKIQLTPIINAEQQTRFSEFQTRAKGSWNGKGRR